MAVAEHAHGRRYIEAFRERTQHFCNPMRCRFEAVQRGIASGAEGGGAGLAAQGLDALYFPLNSIADQRVDVRIRDPIVHTGTVGAGEPVGGNPFVCTPAAFPFTPGDDRRTCWG
jgi:hypothetical protein